MVQGVEDLKEQSAATPTELTDKFKGDAFKGELRYASLDTFYKGLVGLIGEPTLTRCWLSIRRHAGGGGRVSERNARICLNAAANAAW